MLRSFHQSSPKESVKLILIDDDRAFSLIMKDFAKTMGINLDCLHSLEELGSIGKLVCYDGAIIDFDLGDFNGIEIAQYFQSFFEAQKPVVLISGKDRSHHSCSWPNVIQSFLHKDCGPQAILDKICWHLFNKLPKNKKENEKISYFK